MKNASRSAGHVVVIDEFELPQKLAQAMNLIDRAQDSYGLMKKLNLFSEQADLLCQSLLCVSNALTGMVKLTNILSREKEMELDKEKLADKVKLIKLTGIANAMANSVMRSTQAGLVQELLAVLQTHELKELVELSQGELMELLGVSWEEQITGSAGQLTGPDGQVTYVGKRSGKRRMVGPLMDFEDK